MKLPFWKMTGAGNDFVLLAGAPLGGRGPSLARRLCDRRFGVGADGLLGLSRVGGRVRLDYWNADGSAAFCGNGSRCAALWAAQAGWVKGKSFSFDSVRGPLKAVLTGVGRASIAMPVPSGLALNRTVAVDGKKYLAHFVDTGVPHAVVFVKDLEKVPVDSLGRALRFHPAFGKAGANIDFVQLRKNILHLRTYERGVEAETLACGTGVVATAVVAKALGKAGKRAAVRVRGDAVLHVAFAGERPSLEGPGRIVFTGEVTP